MRQLHDEMIDRVVERMVARVTDLDTAAMLVTEIRDICRDPALVALKKRVDPIVHAALDLHDELPAIVKKADLVALAIERRDVMFECPRDWQLPESAIEHVRVWQCWPSRQACDAMFTRLRELDAAMAEVSDFPPTTRRA
jgi:hypothetical protein